MQRYFAALGSAVLAFSLTVGCAGPQTGALSARVETLEAREARIAALETRLSEVESQNQRLAQILDMMATQLDSMKSMANLLGAMEPPAEERQPDESAVYAVPVDGSPVEGPSDARVTIVKAFEFACPFCERTRGTLDQIRERYGDQVRIVYKHFIVHQGSAELPAQAVCAAAQQGKFTQMKDAIWDRAFKVERDFSEQNMMRLARRLKLNLKRFRGDMEGACAERVQRDHQAMARLGVSGTPYFFINGRLLRGAQPLPQFTALIDEELAKANAIITEKGVAPGDYYETQVVAQGRTEM